MTRIKLLDEDTINKIAAGEVIERPASAVKELIENSIDSGADRILIEVKDGGKSLIRITDNGCGMEPGDLPLAFQKHATSKISTSQDLDKIVTLGFRGEALASIASVSRKVEVYTKTRDSLSGTHLLMERGRIVETRETGCPIGTSISISDLFYNVPARHKHLKDKESELAYIANVVTETAIVNWGISFELFSGKRTLFKSIKSGSWDDALLRIFGLETMKSMAAIQAEGRGWSLKGCVSNPLCTRSSQDRIFIYINGRAITSRALSGALRDAYRNIIPLGRSPMAVVSLNVIPEFVDVNVHPAKREIRLLHEDEICFAITKAVSEALHAPSKPRETVSGATSLPVQASSKSALAASYLQRTLPLEPGNADEAHESLESPKIRIIGQILDLYIIAEGEGELIIIDQHAAAERIRFELLQERYRDKKIKQELVTPIAIELSPSEQILMSSWQEALNDIGFDIAPFGGNTYNIRSVPALGKKLEDPNAVHDVLRDLFKQGKAGPGSMKKDDILKLLACRGSIKSGKKLTFGEMNELLMELYKCNNPLTCPHGRPVMVTIGQNQLERLFFRR